MHFRVFRNMPQTWNEDMLHSKVLHLVITHEPDGILRQHSRDTESRLCHAFVCISPVRQINRYLPTNRSFSITKDRTGESGEEWGT